MHETLLAWSKDRGFRVAWGPRSTALESKAGISSRGASGELDPDLFAAEFEPLVRPEELPEWATLVLVAMPRPAHRVEFEIEGAEPLKALLPPTYLRYQATFEEVRQDLAKNGLPGARVEHLHGPCKAMAARLGLVRYGRNNITYAEGMGSYLQLCGFFTDASLPERPLPEGPSLLPECDGCRKCGKACPTGAIREDRILLGAQRCLTHVNEDAGDWPAWVPEGRHNSLVGCLVCQRVCPANPTLSVEETGLRFSARETAALIDPARPLPPSEEDGVRKKLAWLGQPGLHPILGRNLAALLRARVAG